MVETKTNDMDIYEMPFVESNGIETEAGYYENKNNVSVKDNVKKDLGLNQAALSFSNGEDALESFSGVLAVEPEETKINTVTSSLEQEKNKSIQTLKASMDFEPEQMELVVGSERERLVSLENDLESNPKLAPFVSYVNSIEGSHRLSDKAKRDIAADMLTINTVSEIWDDMSKWGVVKDFLGMMVVPDDNWNTKEFSNSINSQKEAVLGFEDPRFWEKYANKRAGLSADEKVLFDEKTLEVLEGVDDNKIEYIMNLMRSIGHDVDSANDLGAEAVELATMLAGTGATVLRNFSKMSKLVTAAKAGNAKMSKFFAEMSFKSETSGAESGVHPLDAASSGSGITSEGVREVSKGVVPEEMAPTLRNVMDEVDVHLKEAENTIDLDSTLLSDSDVDTIVEQFSKRFSKNGNITNIVVEKKGDSIVLNFDHVNDEGVLVKESVPFIYTKDDIGDGLLQSSDNIWGAINKPVASPRAVMGKDSKEFVELVEVALHQQAKVNNSLIRAFNAALAPIKGNKKSLKNLNVMLQKLNGKDVALGYNELVVTGYGGQKLTPDEFIAWKGVRHIMDEVHATNDRILRGEMELRGIKSVELGGNNSAYARAYDEPSSALRGYESDSHANVLVIGNKADDVPTDFNKITLEDIKDMEAKGYKLVKSDSKNIDDTFSSGNKRYKFAFVKSDAIKPLDAQVLNYVPNYVPRTYKDANFFIRVSDEVMVDGVPTKIPRTVAFATTKSQALKWMAKRNQVERESGLEITQFEDLVFDGDKAMGQGEDAVRMNGGLVRGSRSQNKLEYAGFTDSDEMINDPLNTIQEALNFTAKRMPMSRFRIGLQERLYNELDTIDRGLRGISWNELRGSIEGANITTQRKSRILTAYDQIDALVGVPTKSEQGFQSLLRAVAESFDKSNPKLAGWLYRNSVKNPVQAIKNASFQLTLGSFSVVQLPIQMMSAANAFAVAPKKFAEALPRAMYAATFDVRQNKAMMNILKGKKSAPDGFEKDYDLWVKSGFKESVVQAGGDFGSIARGQPYDAGLLRRGFDTTLESGQMFFRSGELWNRRLSFFTALQELKEIKGNKFKYSDQDLAEVMARAERMMLGMGAGNKAPFQKGFWGLPLQFKQIYTKSFEAYTGDWFTPTEKASIGAVQVGLFGAAGIPFVSSMADHLIGQMPDAENMTSEQVTALRRGISGWLVNDYLDVDALFSGRMTSSVDLWGEISKTFVEDVPFYETAFGASMGPINNIWKTAKITSHEAGRLLNADDLSVDQVMVAGEVIGQSLLNIPAGTRNLVAAYDLYNNQVFRNSKGQPIANTDATLRDALSRAIGYQSQEKSDLYELAMSDRALQETRRHRADMYVDILHKLAISREDDNLREAYKYQLEYLKNDIKSYPDGNKILKDIENRLKSADGKKEEAIEKAFKNRQSDMVDAVNKISLLLREE